jgi:hypothetical protein
LELPTILIPTPLRPFTVAPGDEADGLDGLIREMRAQNVIYPPSTDPRWAWYDDRDSPVEYLRETVAARRIMLNQYGPAIL